MAPATRARILAAAQELSFHPSSSARALSNRRAHAVGLVVARPARVLAADPFFPEFIAGVQAELSRGASALVLLVVGDSAEEEAAGYARLHAENRVDGVLLTDLRTDDSRFVLVRTLGLCAVAVGAPSPPVPVPSAVVPDAPGMLEAVRHLVTLGHRRIAHVSGPGNYVHSISRRVAFRAAVREAGVSGVVAQGDFTGRGGSAATRRLLRRPDRPTAIVYANDLMAAAGLSTARQAGLDVPADLSVIGFDDAPLSAHLHPPLTTVAQDIAPWARTAAAMLLDLTEGGSPADAVLPAARLVIRSSTAPP